MDKRIYFIGLWLLILCLVGVSCKTVTPTNSFLAVDREEVVNFIVYTNHVKTFIGNETGDTYYAIPHVNWVKNQFAPKFRNFLWVNRLYYSDEDNDCEDFVHYGITVGRLLYYETPGKLKNHGLAIGSLSYLYQIESHQILMFVAHDNKQLKLLFYEAQFGTPIEINPSDVLVWDWSL